MLLRSLLDRIKGSWLHPQWLSDRYHDSSRRQLEDVRSGLVIDIGSGNSDHRSLLGKGVKLVRLDYPDTNARYRYSPDIFADGTRLPLANDCADVVLLLEVLEHVPDFHSMLAEIQRVLKPEGVLYLSVPFIYPAHDQPYDFHRFTLHGLRSDLAVNGLEVFDTIQHGNSLVVAAQMVNLALLELVKIASEKSVLFAVVSAMMVYPLCILMNLLASPFLAMTFNNAAVLGYFVAARRAAES